MIRFESVSKEYADGTLAVDALSLTATTGIDYSKGDYGTGVDTEILIVPFSLRYKTGDLRLSATIPWPMNAASPCTTSAMPRDSGWSSR